MPEDYIGSCVKWAHNEKDAIRSLLCKNVDKDGILHFKRGGTGILLTIKEITKYE
jgi:hypothetical protein